MKYVVYFNNMYGKNQIELMLNHLMHTSPNDHFFILFGENDKIEMLDNPFSIRKFVKSIAMKLKLRFR